MPNLVAKTCLLIFSLIFFTLTLSGISLFFLKSSFLNYLEVFILQKRVMTLHNVNEWGNFTQAMDVFIENRFKVYDYKSL